jgi:hypothetical protein
VSRREVRPAAFGAANDLAAFSITTVVRRNVSAPVFGHYEITGGDLLPYGIAANRRMLEAVIQHSVEQGIISAPIAVETCFLLTRMPWRADGIASRRS